MRIREPGKITDRIDFLGTQKTAYIRLKAKRLWLLHDFSLYMESLRKLAAYEVELCAFAHHGVFVADQAKSILQ